MHSVALYLDTSVYTFDLPCKSFRELIEASAGRPVHHKAARPPREVAVIRADPAQEQFLMGPPAAAGRRAALLPETVRSIECRRVSRKSVGERRGSVGGWCQQQQQRVEHAARHVLYVGRKLFLEKPRKSKATHTETASSLATTSSATSHAS